MNNFVRKLFKIPQQQPTGTITPRQKEPRFDMSNVHVGDMLRLVDESEIVIVRHVYPTYFRYGRDGYVNWQENCTFNKIIENYGTKESRQHLEANLEKLREI